MQTAAASRFNEDYRKLDKYTIAVDKNELFKAFKVMRAFQAVIQYEIFDSSCNVIILNIKFV